MRVIELVLKAAMVVMIAVLVGAFIYCLCVFAVAIRLR